MFNACRNHADVETLHGPALNQRRAEPQGRDPAAALPLLGFTPLERHGPSFRLRDVHHVSDYHVLSAHIRYRAYWSREVMLFYSFQTRLYPIKILSVLP